MELPSIGDIVGVEKTSNGVGTGHIIEVEVLHVHTVRKTGRTQVEVRSTKPVHIGRMVGRKVDYSARIATQYVDPQWLRPRPAPKRRRINSSSVAASAPVQTTKKRKNNG
jgi:hypothetical protein